MWVLNPFSSDETDDSDALLELKVKYYQKVAFQTFAHQVDFWASMLHVQEFRELAEQATSKFVQMPTSYLCEQAFSSLILIIIKKKRERHTEFGSSYEDCNGKSSEASIFFFFFFFMNGNTERAQCALSQVCIP